jgi:hypothetical protein
MNQIEALSQYNLSQKSILSLLTCSKWFEDQCGFDVTKYWKGDFNHLDEVMITVNAYIASDELLGRSKIRGGRRENFDWYYILISKLNLQTINSILNLVEKKSYFDCFSLLRNYQARVLEMLYISIYPEKTKDWIKNHKSSIFREENIRKKLKENNITTLEHLYMLGNDITHDNYEGLQSLGFEEKGICPYIPFTENQVYVLLKLLTCIAGYIAIIILKVSKNMEDNSLQGEIEELNNLYELIINRFLNPGDSRHLWLFFVEDRHCKSNENGEAILAQWFNFYGYKELVTHLYEKKI